MFDPIKHQSYVVDYNVIKNQLIFDLKSKGLRSCFESDKTLEQYISKWMKTIKQQEIDEKDFKPTSVIHEFYALPIIFNTMTLNIYCDINKMIANLDNFSGNHIKVAQDEIIGPGSKVICYDKSIKVNSSHKVKTSPLLAVEWFNADGRYTIVDGNHRLNVDSFKNRKYFDIVILDFLSALAWKDTVFLSDFDAAVYALEFELLQLAESIKSENHLFDINHSLYNLF